MSSNKPCNTRKSFAECEPSGLLARFMNCSWDAASGLCLSAAQKKLHDSEKLQPAASNAEKPKTFLSSSTKSNKYTSSESIEGSGGGITRHLSKDCNVPACRTKTSAFARVMARSRKANNEADSPQNYTAESFAKRNQCPAGREELGNNSWVLLHSIAAYYPDEPTEEDRTRAIQFIEAIGHFYPCSHCAEAFREDIKSSPPNVKSRSDFSVWMCKMHNKVNAKLDKPVFPCNIDTLDARWKIGHASCWATTESAKNSLGHFD